MQMVLKATSTNPKSTQRRDWGGKGEDFEKAIILEVILGIILRIIGWPIQEEGIPAKVIKPQDSFQWVLYGLCRPLLWMK